MRYVIVGAGAIGGVLGARLAQHSSEHPPLLIARGEHGDAIRRNGLRLRSPDDDVTVGVTTAQSPDEVQLRSDDVLVFATKTHQVEQALTQWVDRPVAGADATAGEVLPVFLALNGVASERIALRYFSRVFGICVWLPAVHLDPGEVLVRIAPRSGTFIVGRYGAEADATDSALLEMLAADWTAATFDVHVVSDVMLWKHRKLLSNLGNAVQALVGTDVSARAVTTALRREAEAVYRLHGIEWATTEEEEAWRGGVFDTRPVPGIEEDQGGSSWQSMKRGTGSIETDFLNGEIAYLARAIGEQAPYNDALQRLARQYSAATRAPGSMSVGELEQHLGLRADEPGRGESS